MRSFMFDEIEIAVCNVTCCDYFPIISCVQAQIVAATSDGNLDPEVRGSIVLPSVIVLTHIVAGD